MRAAFALLVLGLLGATAWALWDDAHPEWRRYQRQLVEREVARLTGELDAARREAARPEVRAELARLDRLLLREENGTRAAEQGEVAGGGDAAARTGPEGRGGAESAALDSLDALVQDLRTAVRHADRDLLDPESSARRQEILDLLGDVQARYAAATGTWPPDPPALARLWAVRDSLSDALAGIEAPARELRERLDVTRAEADSLHRVARARGAVRDSLERERERLVAAVTEREAALARLRNAPAGIRAIVSPDGREVARCPTCHGTIDDPPGVHPALPAAEVFRDVPCTVCHRGAGRALDVDGAHRGLLSGAGSGAGAYSLWARIDRLRRAGPADRPGLLEDLQRITGADPVATAGADLRGVDADSAAVALWTEWWSTSRDWFDPGEGPDGDDDANALSGAGVDPWMFSVQGRPLRYVGSRECLGCHEVRHREHCRRWMETKFRSIERLVDEPEPGPCLECHATGWDAATGAYAEPGVTCEGCHGPGERYSRMMIVGQELLTAGNDERGNALLDQASRLAREAVSRRSLEGDSGAMNVCVRCHHPRRHRDRGPGFLERRPAEAPPGETG